MDGGHTYFFTVNLAERSRTDHVEDFRRVVRKVKQAHPLDILAWVVLPDHLHAIWSLPEGDGDCAARNPVKHGHVSRASDWPYSSIHRYIRLGWMPADWASEVGDGPAVGER